uniref:Uncharacterized protein n=1 Tax=Caenorhabditis japonica TaxID=281687 RepID=A0A8R1IEF4_CAEJA
MNTAPDVTARELETMLGCSLLSFFWDAKGMLYYELLSQGRTINATTYSFREVRRPQNGSIRLLRLAVRRVLEERHRRPPRAMAHSCD